MNCAQERTMQKPDARTPLMQGGVVGHAAQYYRVKAQVDEGLNGRKVV